MLYGKSKGNTEFINVQEAFRKVRRDLDISAKEGLFNIEKSQSVLLDIRQIKLNLEERRSK